MTNKKKILFVFGTRPEAIKMAPLVKLLKRDTSYETIVCVTGQHREMLDQVLELFEIIPDYDLKVMKKGQDLFDITSRILLGLKEIIENVKPDLILVHGDTTTSMTASLAGFYKQVPVGHVEAGLRTNNKYSPWPEEINRKINGCIADFNFAPTESSKQNLLNENSDPDSIYVTGNTVIDALHYIINRIKNEGKLQQNVENQIKELGYDLDRLNQGRRLVLITGHRRENFGKGFENIFHSLDFLSNKYKNIDFVYPLHLNPRVREPINKIFNDIPENLFLLEPFDYLPFVYLMSKSYIILTDSGGIQEEAPGLGIPVLVMRDTTERPEAVESGTVKLVGVSYNSIKNNVIELIENEEIYNSMSSAKNPFGDGDASEKILNVIKDIL